LASLQGYVPLPLSHSERIWQPWAQNLLEAVVSYSTLAGVAQVLVEATQKASYRLASDHVTGHHLKHTKRELMTYAVRVRRIPEWRKYFGAIFHFVIEPEVHFGLA
jgi:hypothetical protein